MTEKLLCEARFQREKLHYTRTWWKQINEC